MTTDRELDEILAEIGREHRAMGAPQSLEAALRAAADSRKDAIGERNARLTWAWAAAAILLAMIAARGVIWQMRKGESPQHQQARSVPEPEATRDPLPSARAATRDDAAAVSARARKASADRARLQEASTKQATANSLDEFVPLPASEGLPPAAELSVVRIKLIGSDLQQYGLQAPADAVAQTMLAEFVVGEDGLPRAIRIVR
jgi:hypothetical protein